MGGWSPALTAPAGIAGAAQTLRIFDEIRPLQQIEKGNPVAARRT